MNKLKISILFDEDRDENPPKHDEVVDEVAAALEENGHKVSLLGISDNAKELINKLDVQKPDLVFNLCETFADNYYGEMYVTAVLSMLNIRFTGTGPAGMASRQDKAVTKKLLAFHDVPCPNYATFSKDKLEFAGKMRFPLFVKPLRRDASAGITDSSLVNNYEHLMRRIDYIHNRVHDTALVEEYIDGREFFVGVLGNFPPEPLPLIELDFSKLPPDHPRIYTEKAKFDEESEEFNTINFGVATDLSPEMRDRITNIGARAASALGTSDYARVDIRLGKDGIPYVVEVNANPYLERTAEFAVAALQAGMGYSMLVNRIVDLAWSRWEETEKRRQVRKEPAKKESPKKEEKTEEKKEAKETKQ